MAVYEHCAHCCTYTETNFNDECEKCGHSKKTKPLVGYPRSPNEEPTKLPGNPNRRPS